MLKNNNRLPIIFMSLYKAAHPYPKCLNDKRLVRDYLNLERYNSSVRIK